MIGFPGESLRDLKNARRGVEHNEGGFSNGFGKYLAVPPTPVRIRIPPIPSGDPGALHPEKRHLPEPRAVERPTGTLSAAVVRSDDITVRQCILQERVLQNCQAGLRLAHGVNGISTVSASIVFCLWLGSVSGVLCDFAVYSFIRTLRFAKARCDSVMPFAHCYRIVCCLCVCLYRLHT
jgi:hypothetical protein